MDHQSPVPKATLKGAERWKCQVIRSPSTTGGLTAPSARLGRGTRADTGRPALLLGKLFPDLRRRFAQEQTQRGSFSPAQFGDITLQVRAPCRSPLPSPLKDEPALAAPQSRLTRTPHTPSPIPSLAPPAPDLWQTPRGASADLRAGSASRHAPCSASA